MRMRCLVGLLALVAVTPFVVSSPLLGRSEQLDDNVAAKVSVLSARLRFREDDAAGKARYRRELKDVTDRLLSALDLYIERAVNEEQDSGQIQAGLRNILAEHRPNPEYGDLPFARVDDLRAGRSLVVAYTIVRGSHDDIATIRGYRSNRGRFDLVATAGEEFEGFNMFRREVPSQIPGELWFLAWGQAQTFNGSYFRLRLYAFDGQSIRTMWKPDDMMDARVTLSTLGFVIDHVARDNVSWHNVHDEYTLTPRGAVKTSCR